MKPWQVKSWVIPEAGADFVCAMEDVLEVYERPYDENNPVICFDESPRQLIQTSLSQLLNRCKNGVLARRCSRLLKNWTFITKPHSIKSGYYDAQKPYISKNALSDVQKIVHF
jgi:hypothetical protein